MKLFFALCLGLNLFLPSALGQHTEIDSYCRVIDSTITAGKNIGEFLLEHPSDVDPTRLYDRFFIDTVNFVLLKAIYDCNYYANEYIRFYYRDSKLIRINAHYELADKKYAGVFHYQNDNPITLTNRTQLPGFYAFDLVELQKTAHQYLHKSSEILDSIKRNKNPDPNNRQ